MRTIVTLQNTHTFVWIPLRNSASTDPPDPLLIVTNYWSLFLVFASIPLSAPPPQLQLFLSSPASAVNVIVEIVDSRCSLRPIFLQFVDDRLRTNGCCFVAGCASLCCGAKTGVGPLLSSLKASGMSWFIGRRIVPALAVTRRFAIWLITNIRSELPSELWLWSRSAHNFVR